jgi:hypothetical protein
MMARVVEWLLPGDDARVRRGGHQAAATEVRPAWAWFSSKRRARISSSERSAGQPYAAATASFSARCACSSQAGWL